MIYAIADRQIDWYRYIARKHRKLEAYSCHSLWHMTFICVCSVNDLLRFQFTKHLVNICPPTPWEWQRLLNWESKIQLLNTCMPDIVQDILTLLYPCEDWTLLKWDGNYRRILRRRIQYIVLIAWAIELDSRFVTW